MSEMITGLVANIGTYFDVILAFVGAFALLATLTPNKSDDQWVQTIQNAINFLGANIGKAKNPPEE